MAAFVHPVAFSVQWHKHALDHWCTDWSCAVHHVGRQLLRRVLSCPALKILFCWHECTFKDCTFCSTILTQFSGGSGILTADWFAGRGWACSATVSACRCCTNSGAGLKKKKKKHLCILCWVVSLALTSVIWSPLLWPLISCVRFRLALACFPWLRLGTCKGTNMRREPFCWYVNVLRTNPCRFRWQLGAMQVPPFLGDIFTGITSHHQGIS